MLRKLSAKRHVSQIQPLKRMCEEKDATFSVVIYSLLYPLVYIRDRNINNKCQNMFGKGLFWRSYINKEHLVLKRVFSRTKILRENNNACLLKNRLINLIIYKSFSCCHKRVYIVLCTLGLQA